MKIRKGLRIAIPMAVVALGLVMASVAWACSAYNGQTFIKDPTTGGWDTFVEVQGSRRAATSITIKGDGVNLGTYGTANGDTYQAIMANAGECCLGGQNLGGKVTLKQSATEADVGPTAVDIAAGTSGNKWICMLNESTDTDDSTAHASLSVL